MIQEYLEQERLLGLHAGPGPGNSIEQTLDHWKDNLAENGTREYHDHRGLPPGAVRKLGTSCEEV